MLRHDWFKLVWGIINLNDTSPVTLVSVYELDADAFNGMKTICLNPCLNPTLRGRGEKQIGTFSGEDAQLQELNVIF